MPRRHRAAHPELLSIDHRPHAHAIGHQAWGRPAKAVVGLSFIRARPTSNHAKHQAYAVRTLYASSMVGRLSRLLNTCSPYPRRQSYGTTSGRLTVCLAAPRLPPGEASGGDDVNNHRRLPGPRRPTLRHDGRQTSSWCSWTAGATGSRDRRGDGRPERYGRHPSDHTQPRAADHAATDLLGAYADALRKSARPIGRTVYGCDLGQGSLGRPAARLTRRPSARSI